METLELELSPSRRVYCSVSFSASCHERGMGSAVMSEDWLSYVDLLVPDGDPGARAKPLHWGLVL